MLSKWISTTYVSKNIDKSQAIGVSYYISKTYLNEVKVTNCYLNNLVYFVLYFNLLHILYSLSVLKHFTVCPTPSNSFTPYNSVNLLYVYHMAVERKFKTI